MRSTTWSSDIWDWEEGTDEAGHPIVGVYDVMEQVEIVFFMKPSGKEIGFDLPKIGVELMTALNTQQSAKEGWQVHVFDVDVLGLKLTKSVFNCCPVRFLRQDP
jgi:hypothetical protein